jgi:hypothetical protein
MDHLPPDRDPAEAIAPTLIGVSHVMVRHGGKKPYHPHGGRGILTS